MYLLNIFALSGKFSLSSTQTLPEAAVNFTAGDRVRVTVNEEQLKHLQSGHGGWNPRMVQVGHIFENMLEYYRLNNCGHLYFSISEKSGSCIE